MTRSPFEPLERALALFALIAVLAAGCAPSAPGSASTGDEAIEIGGEPARGDLGIVALTALSVVSAAGDRRVLAHVLVENRSELDLPSPWRLELSRRGERIGLSECIGRELPSARVAHCAMWLGGGALEDGDLLEGRLDRGLEQFGEWDADPGNDARVTAIRWSGGERVLEVARWSIVPESIPEPGEVRFSFTVEGGHLVWLVTPWEAPRLLGGDPADGPIDGRGRMSVPRTGTVALVARNSLGAFVYETRRVAVGSGVGRVGVSGATVAAEETAQATILAEGIFDVEENALILSDLVDRLAAPR